MKKDERVLSVMAHPDDAEIFCAGTLARLQEIGFDIHIATMTPGDCGSKHQSPSDIARVRLEEARTAASRIRAGFSCLDFRDLQITYDPPAIRKAVELLRQIDPVIVITHSPQDYLLDHEITSLLVRNACFAAPVPNFQTGRLPSRPPAGRIPHLYYASPAAGIDIFGESVPATVYIDISDVMGLKSDMLSCHKSQHAWLRAQHGTADYLDEMRQWNSALGKQIGVEYAEGFRQHLGHPYPKDDRLGKLLGGTAKRAG